MNAVLSFALVPVLLAVALSTQSAARPPQVTKARAQTEAQVLRGHYIVFGVAGCSDCHTPRDEDGNPIVSRLLMGGPTPFLPVRETPGWPTLVPRIAGAVPGTDEEMVTLLTTGVWKSGRSLRAPMPQFGMTREDAEAVVAFLKSL